MRINRLFVYAICAVLMCSTFGHTTFAQEKEKIGRATISGEIVAYDQLISLSRLTIAPDLHTFIIKNVSAKSDSYLILNYMTFDFEFLKKVEKGSKIKLKAIRDENCDADVESLENVESDGVKLPRMKWFDSETPKPTSVMPCYTADHGIKFVKF